MEFSDLSRFYFDTYYILWETLDEDEFLAPQHQASLIYRTPSFSWASIDLGAVGYSKFPPKNLTRSAPDMELDAVVIDAQCTLKGANLFGGTVGIYNIPAWAEGVERSVDPIV